MYGRGAYVGFDVEGIIRVFTGLLHQPRLASALRRHREDVLSAALQFSVSLTIVDGSEWCYRPSIMQRIIILLYYSCISVFLPPL